jgi:hypothetical protein
VHHVVELYHVISGLWKFYGEWESVFRHALAMHDDNRCEGVTICETCHENLHPGRMVAVTNNEELQSADWCVMPRKLNVKFALGARGRASGQIGLLGLQALLGIGWHIMNGYGTRIIDFNWRRFASLMGKTAGKSFSNGLEVALNSLQEAGILDAWAKDGNSLEVHLTKKYLDEMEHNPWFISLEEAKTSRMSTLVLRWLLSFQANRSAYRIGRDKLAGHMQLGTRTPAFVRKCVSEACSEIPWAEMEEDGDNIRFRFKSRGMVPIHSLRALLTRNLADE